MLYLISYDLTKKPESEYEELIALIESWGGIRILYSEWLVASDSRATEIRDALLPHVVDNDLIWVMEVTTNSAWRGVRGGKAASDAAKELFRQYART